MRSGEIDEIGERTRWRFELGGGKYTFEVRENWAKIAGRDRARRFRGGRGRQPRQRLCLQPRRPPGRGVRQADGNLLRTWGEGVFTRPHGVHVAPDDTIWLTDDGDHTVRHCTLDGKVLMTLGVPGKPTPLYERRAVSPLHPHRALAAGRPPLHLRRLRQRPHPQIHAGRQALMSWGEPGTDPGQFNMPHNICCDPDGWVYVADRENHRVQVFDGNGKWETQWNNLHRPNGMCLAHGADPAVLYRRGRPAGRDQPRLAQYRPARQHPHAEGQGLGAARQDACRASRPGSSPRRTASPSTATATSMSANCPGRSWARFSKDPPPKRIRVLHKLEKVAA